MPNPDNVKTIKNPKPRLPKKIKSVKIHVPDVLPEKENISIKPTTYKKSFIMILNGGEGSGKSSAALTFPNPFVIDLEFKLPDLIAYRTDLQWMQEKKDYVVAIEFDEKSGEVDWTKTYNNILYWINWYKTEGYKLKDTLIIDVGKAIREASIRDEEEKKGRSLGKIEYIPITKANKKLLKPLIHFCRTHGKNLIFITHWEGIYKTIIKDGYEDTVQIGRTADIKEWIRNLVSWRIDFLKPDESGFDEKFILYFNKAPGEQYYSIDLTNDNLYEILSNPEILQDKKDEFRKTERIRQIKNEENKKK